MSSVEKLITTANSSFWSLPQTTRPSFRPPTSNSISNIPVLFRNIDNMYNVDKNKTFMCQKQTSEYCSNVCDNTTLNRKCIRCFKSGDASKVYTGITLDDKMNFKCSEEQVLLHTRVVTGPPTCKFSTDKQNQHCEPGWKYLGTYGMPANLYGKVQEDYLGDVRFCGRPVQIGDYITREKNKKTQNVLVPFELCRGTVDSEKFDGLLGLGDQRDWKRVGVFKQYVPRQDEAYSDCKRYNKDDFQNYWSCANYGNNCTSNIGEPCYDCFKSRNCRTYPGSTMPARPYMYQCSTTNDDGITVNPNAAAWPVDFYAVENPDTNEKVSRTARFATQKDDTNKRTLPGQHMIFAAANSKKDALRANKYFGQSTLARDQTKDCAEDNGCFVAGAYPLIVKEQKP